MFLELIAVVLAGVAAAGILMLINRGIGGRLPRWLVPVAAGLAMLAATISNEYNWFDRTKGSLPDGIEVAQTVENQVFYRPWTYAFPYVDRFVAVDTATARQHPEKPGVALVDIYYFGRWTQVNKVPMIGDCVLGRRAVLSDDVAFAEDGTITGAAWVNAGTDDPVLTTLCKEIS
ncbi:hypothetical protein [Shimia sp. SDUM112013]|uniref:hypothetical protein n=1 Tax=Shimia sp. SDUM112013 TaxID=3136160 RepID=UPI0032EDA2FF